MIFARFLSICVALAILAACGSAPPLPDRYYSLVLAADSGDVAGDEIANARLIVGPIELPSYLSKHGIAMQMGPNRIESANHHFWAEPLDEAIAKVLTRDIAERTDGIAVERESGRWTPSEDCRVRVEFDAFHPTNNSQVVMSGRYWISSENSSDSQEFSLSRSLTIDGYAHAVDVLRDTLAVLAQQISEDVQGEPACAGQDDPGTL